MASPFKPVVLRPLTGPLDNRTEIDNNVPGSFREKLNWAISPEGRFRRAHGWQRFYKLDCPTDHDAHTDAATGEPITMLFESVSNDDVRRLFRATKTRIKVLDETAGTWTEIGSGFGNDGLPSLTQVRFHAAELQNQVVLTNNLDKPQIYTLGDAAVTDLADLSNVDNEIDGHDDGTGLTKARVVVQYNGFIFLMNVVEGGVRIPSRIRWCHLNLPTAWKVGDAVPTGTSLADYIDLTYGEEILNALVMAGSLWVFTNQSIRRCTIVADPGSIAPPVAPSMTLNVPFAYNEPKTQARCLAYPNAIISTGAKFYYAGRDSIYSFDQYMIEPERTEWVYRATGLIYKSGATQIDRNACESPVMEFRPATNDDDSAGGGEIHFSWPHYVSIAGQEPAPEPNCSDFTPPAPPTGDGINRNTLVLNTKWMTCDYRDYGSTAMVNFRKNALGPCNQQVVLISANGEDLCLKELDFGNGREMYNVATGLYTMRGYYSRFILVFPFDTPQSRKEINGFSLEATPDVETDTAVFRLRTGTSDSALDPAATNGSCRVLWKQRLNQRMACRYKMSAEQYATKKIQPRDPCAWGFLTRGRFLYVEVTIAAADNSAPVTGGTSISRLETMARVVPEKA